MYQKGDLIIYSGHGVCHVLDVGIPNIPGMEVNTAYYTLSPAYVPGLIYVPVNTDIFMRPIISQEDAASLIRRLPTIKEAILRTRNTTILRQFYDEYINTHDCEALFQIIKGIYLKKQRDNKLGQTDQKYMKQAEDLLYGELAVALGIPFEEVVPYIEKTVAAIST